MKNIPNVSILKNISRSNYRWIRSLQNWSSSNDAFYLPDEGIGSTSLTSSDNLDLDYFLNPDNLKEINRNLKLRRLQGLEFGLFKCQGDQSKIEKYIVDEISQFPNKLHSRWANLDPSNVDFKEEIPVVELHGEMPKFEFTPKKAERILNKMKLLLLANENRVGYLGGPRSYVLLGDLARLEKALERWTMKQLVRKFNFTPVVVPNLVYQDIVEGCGFNPKSVRSQVYTIDGTSDNSWKERSKKERRSSPNTICLSGTAEIPLVGLHLGKRFDIYSEEKSEQFPKKYCALSRCYRAEASNLSEEGGLYRLHYFEKVEMVGLTRLEDSEKMLEEFVNIQKHLFSQLGLHFKVLDMPPHELGLPARRKFDIEAYFPGRKQWGEISSASDCSDYQSRRFNIKYRYFSPDYNSNEPFKEEFAATVNGTACASPRILLPLIETNQDSQGRIRIPDVLREEMDGQEFIERIHIENK